MSVEASTSSAVTEKVQHELNDEWCFWYCPRFGHKKYITDDYQRNLRLLGECNTVESFFNNYVYL